MSTTANPVQTAGPQTDHTFPQQIKVTLVLELLINSQDERDYYLNKDTGALALPALADTFDSWMPMVDAEQLLTVNGMTPAAVQKALKAEAGE